MKHQISKKERALLTVAGAQRLAGAGRTPSARQVRRAHVEAGCAVAKRGVVVHGGAGATDRMFDKVCTKLSGIGGETDAECGGFWDKIKAIASRAVPFAPLAALAIPTVALAVPLVRSMSAARQQRPAAPPQQSDDDAAPQDVSGWGDLLGTEISHPAPGYTYLFGDDELGKEDLMLIREGGGSAELAASTRRSAWWPTLRPQLVPRRPARPVTSGSDVMRHDVYRAAIVKRARALGGSHPTTKNMADAQAAVDREMNAYGVRVAIPGATPGRVTR